MRAARAETSKRQPSWLKSCTPEAFFPPRMCNADEHIRLKDVSGTSLFNSNVHAPGRALASRSNRQTPSQHFFTRRECFTSLLSLSLFTTCMCDPVFFSLLFFLLLSIFFLCFLFPLPAVIHSFSRLTRARIPSGRALCAKYAFANEVTLEGGLINAT